MMIKSINLRNIYSFGGDGTPELKGFSQFNLFIGKNGSGKTNVFRALCELDVDLKHNRGTNTFEPRLGFNVICWSHNRRLVENTPNTGRVYYMACDLKIEYASHEVIEFKDGSHLSGDFTLYKGTYIKHDSSKEALEKKLAPLTNKIKLCAVMDFSFKYIFGVDISTSPPIAEKFTKEKEGTKGTSGRSILLNQWSSGYFSVLGLLLDSCNGSRVICIDEPELHLEPRILRKVMDVLMWMSGPDEKMEQEWEDWLEKSTVKNTDNWEDDKNFKPLSRKQIFIASHSPVLINEFLSRENCSIYEFDNEYQDSSYEAHYGPKTHNVEQDSLVSVVRKIPIDKYPHSILDNLGAHGSDLLQTNGVIWVEGPSDVVYIKKWLEMYAKESGQPILKQGTDYEFQMFGGTLLDSLCLIKEGASEEEERKKLVSMFSFSRNAFVITDSDAIKKNGKIVDQSKFKNAKKFIAGQFDELTLKGYKLGLWYKENNTDIRTLEDYLDDDTEKSVGIKITSTTKKIFAQRVVESWGDDKKLGAFKHELENEIESLDSTIRSWNG